MIATEAKIIIREAIEADISRVVEMGRRFLLEGPYRDQIQDSPQGFQNALAALLANPRTRVLVSEDDGSITGMLIFVVAPHYFTGELIAGEVVWYVQPEARRKMAGLRLLNFAEKAATEMGAKRIQFVAPTDRIGRLYERRGYTKIETSYQRSLP